MHCSRCEADNPEGMTCCIERSAYHLATPLDTFQVSATVQALLAARIDRLPPEHKRLLQTAMDTAFWLPQVAALAQVEGR